MTKVTYDKYYDLKSWKTIKQNKTLESVEFIKNGQKSMKYALVSAVKKSFLNFISHLELQVLF